MVAIPSPPDVGVGSDVENRSALLEQERYIVAMEEEIAELAAHIHAATCRLLELILEFDRQNGWQGWKSCAHWLSWRTGIGPEAAREKVRVARALPELPLVREAFAEGRLSYSKVRAISRVATPETEDMLLSIAIHGTAAHVEKVVRGVRRADPEGETEEANRRHEGRYLSTRHDEHGNLVIDGRLPPELGARFLDALDAATEQTSRDDKTKFGQRRADALVLLADSAFSETGGRAGGLPGRAAADAHQVVVHVDAEVLADPANAGRSELEDGVHVSAETSRRIACDAGVVVMVEGEDGEPLSVGRKRRTVPPSIRRALKSRDAGCQFPGYPHTRHLEAHHIEHWAEGGETSLENLIHPCSFHHRELHEGGFRIERMNTAGGGRGQSVASGDAGGAGDAPSGKLRFFNRYGLEVKEAPSSEDRGSAERLMDEQGDLDIRAGRLPLWVGHPIDYGFTVSGLLRAAHRRPEPETAERVSAETSAS